MMEKLQPKLRFPEFEGNWNINKFRDIVKINQGLQIPISERFFEKVEDSYFYITNEFLRESSEKKYFIKNPSQSVICSKDDILMTRTGNTGMVVTNVEGAFHNNFFKISYPNNIAKQYLFYFLKLPNTQKQITRLAGTSTIPDLNHSDFYNIYFISPTLPEQQKIASFLTTVDDKISNLKQKVSLLEKYKKGVMQQIFSQQIRFKDENGNDYPEWEEKSLGEVCEFYSGGTPLTTNKKFYNGNIPFIKSGEIGEKETKQFITELGLKNSSAKLVSKGDILYALYGATSGEVSISQINGAINQAVLCIKSSQNQVYLFQYLKYQKDNIVSTYIQGGQGNLSANIIKELNVALPSIKEQTKIAEFLSGIDKKIETTKLQLSKMEVWKKGFLQGMFC